MKTYNENEVRALIDAVNAYDRRFGAANCFYELFDAGHKLGVCAVIPEPFRRHAVKFNIGDEASQKAAWDEMIAWAAQ